MEVVTDDLSTVEGDVDDRAARLNVGSAKAEAAPTDATDAFTVPSNAFRQFHDTFPHEGRVQ